MHPATPNEKITEMLKDFKGLIQKDHTGLCCHLPQNYAGKEEMSLFLGFFKKERADVLTQQKTLGHCQHLAQ